MSDYDSIMFGLALEASAERDYQQYQADLQEQAEATLAEVLRDLDIDDLLRNQKDLEPYGDPLHTVVRILVDAVQEKIRQTSKQRAEALRKANESIKCKTEKFWADRIQKALKKKRRNPRLSASQIAKRVIEKEIEDKEITDEEKVDHMIDTAAETLRKKLGKNAEFKAIK